MTQKTDTSQKNKGKTIGIITAIIGGVTLLGVGATAAVSTVFTLDESSTQNSGSSNQQLSLTDIDGITEVYVDTSAADFELKFADVNAAQIETSGSSERQWGMTREGTTLVAQSQDKFWLGFGFCLFWCDWQTQTVTLTLPVELDGKLDAELNLGAGSITANGNFNRLELEVSAGSATAMGSAKSLDAALSAGEANLQLSDVEEARLEVSAGRMIVGLSGVAPKDIEAEVSAGGIELTVPDVPYRLSTEIAAGSIDNDLKTDPSSQNRIAVEVAAGSISLQRGIG